MSQIFISHSDDDSKFTHELVNQLKSEFTGISIFASSEANAIDKGDWFKSVLKNLDETEIFIAVVTPRSEKSIWVAFEYGYFWKQDNGYDNIFILRHPKAKLSSPFNVLQAKRLSDPKELRVFFESLSRSLGQTYRGIGNIDNLVELANNLPILSSDELKQQNDLIRKMGSRDNVTALNALQELREMGWLSDGSLRGKTLTNANLNRADLSYSDLREVKLNWASLKEANFTEANLEGANLGGAYLDIPLPGSSQGSSRAASFWYANLRNAILGSAILTGVNFGGADLRGTDFLGANLLLAHALEKAKFDETTRLPDGQMWTADTNLSKYTTLIS